MLGPAAVAPAGRGLETGGPGAFHFIGAFVLLGDNPHKPPLVSSLWWVRGSQVLNIEKGSNLFCSGVTGQLCCQDVMSTPECSPQSGLDFIFNGTPLYEAMGLVSLGSCWQDVLTYLSQVVEVHISKWEQGWQESAWPSDALNLWTKGAVPAICQRAVLGDAGSTCPARSAACLGTCQDSTFAWVLWSATRNCYLLKVKQ